MKILSIGYYDDFARFFLAIKKELQTKESKIEFKYLSLYLSGALYFLSRLQPVSFFSMKVWLNKIIHKKEYQAVVDKHKIYKSINLDKIITYHKLLDSQQENELKLQAISYIDIIEKLLKKYKPDILLLSGDSRMSIEILNIKAKEYNIRTYYFEQGPFGTTILDSNGVNANASIREWQYSDESETLEQKESNINNFFQRKKSQKYKRNPIYRGSDYLFQSIFEKVGLLPIDIKMEKSKKRDNPIYKNINENKYEENKDLFLLVLQVPYDVNMVYHSPFYRNHFSIVEDIFNALPKNSTLLVREHPLYKGKYENELYSFMHEHNISLDTDELNNSLEKADVVVVNNSTVGIEAISKMKPTVVLGNAYYDSDRICLKLINKENLNELLGSALNYKSNKEYVVYFLDMFLSKYLIDGHFRDRKLKATRTIALKLYTGETNV